eukprot:m.489528 g.489528  ORF g.489528 m.489528 type:complete len:84 (-) comp26835_c0_seq1:240-491(-)
MAWQARAQHRLALPTRRTERVLIDLVDQAARRKPQAPPLYIRLPNAFRWASPPQCLQCRRSDHDQTIGAQDMLQALATSTHCQ